jgi:hypothetical protein
LLLSLTGLAVTPFTLDERLAPTAEHICGLFGKPAASPKLAKVVNLLCHFSVPQLSSATREANIRSSVSHGATLSSGNLSLAARF